MSRFARVTSIDVLQTLTPPPVGDVDLAEVKRRGLKLTFAEFGDSDKLFAGETVFAVGTPYGLSRTVTRGIVSAIRLSTICAGA